MRQLHHSKTDHKEKNTITGSSIVNLKLVAPFITFSTKIFIHVFLFLKCVYIFWRTLYIYINRYIKNILIYFIYTMRKRPLRSTCNYKMLVRSISKAYI